MKIVRQGDVLIYPVENFPENVEISGRADSKVLAYGEVTGHSHRFDDDAGVVVLEAPDGDRFLDVQTASELHHEEHGTAIIEPGRYIVEIQRQYTPEGLIKKVTD